MEKQAFFSGLLQCEGSRPKRTMPSLYAPDANVAC
jgi:hypothetical protein